MAFGDYFIVCGSHLAAQVPSFFCHKKNLTFNNLLNLQAFSQFSPAYRYFFTRTPPNWGMAFLNATHLVESMLYPSIKHLSFVKNSSDNIVSVGYVFNNAAALPMLPSFLPEDQQLASAVSSLWASFAATGTPQSPNSKWPVYAAPNFPLLHLDLPLPFSLTYYDHSVCDKWQPILTATN
jgi:carboxylesterase type B